MAEVAGAAVQQGPQLLGSFAGERLRRRLVRAGGATRQRFQPLPIEAMDELACRFLVAAHQRGERRHPLAARAGQHHLAAAHDLTYLSWYGGDRDPAYEQEIVQHFPGAMTIYTAMREETALQRYFDYGKRVLRSARPSEERARERDRGQRAQ